MKTRILQSGYYIGQKFDGQILFLCSLGAIKSPDELASVLSLYIVRLYCIHYAHVRLFSMPMVFSYYIIKVSMLLRVNTIHADSWVPITLWSGYLLNRHQIEL